jgi:hypothetical protein
MGQSFRSKAAMGTDTGMGGAITAVAATTTVGTAVVTMVGTAATTMVGAIIAIGGEQRERERLHWLAASFIETLLARSVISRLRTGLGPTLMDETNIAVIARLARNDEYARQSTGRMMSSMVHLFCHHK